jgi:hypothetical protein
VKVRRFDPNDDLIIVKARVFGRHDSRKLSLAFDTAASHTHISSDVIDEPGYRRGGHVGMLGRSARSLATRCA